ncbi:hypothetical protein [Halorhabdus sp. CUG00001]|uniref:hypothetical protein n=1 Tax=Halorhabdus sp. CUG00001 TaxID=2600297 RepID=UPI00131DCD3E|nr:hypothetical protein [Halorhabdus sp. CUG00001]
MQFKPLLICCCLVLAGCSGAPDTATDSPEQRFDGDANAEVTVYNPTNGTWNVSYRVERGGVAVLNATRSVQPGTEWDVTTIDRPGNYTFTISTVEWMDSASVRLPRAVGDRESYIEVAETNGEFGLRLRWEQ